MKILSEHELCDFINDTLGAWVDEEMNENPISEGNISRAQRSAETWDSFIADLVLWMHVKYESNPDGMFAKAVVKSNVGLTMDDFILGED